jgi:hypothetical protein
MRIIFRLFILLSYYGNFAFADSDCIIIKNPDFTDATSKFEIMKPGHYCLVEDLHSRFDFADHRPEARLIQIWSDDVVLDLQGHTLGRGKIFKFPGGVGIEINANLSNITIKNGTIQDFDIGISRVVATLADGKKRSIKPTYDRMAKTYQFQHDNIRITNVRFLNNKLDMKIEEKE